MIPELVAMRATFGVGGEMVAIIVIPHGILPDEFTASPD